MEIYNEEVRDLLARPSHHKTHSLEIKERQDVGVYVKDLLHVTGNNDWIVHIKTLLSW